MRLRLTMLSGAPVQRLAGEGLGSGVDLARPHRSTGQSEHECDRLEHRTRPRWSCAHGRAVKPQAAMREVLH